jgi:hypothetical protein
MHAMTKRMSPPAPDAPEEPHHTPMAVWIPETRECVTIVDLPPPHVPDACCRCAACGVRDVNVRADA